MMNLLADSYMGPMAGIATSLLWTGTALLFAAAGRRIGATAVNASRIALAIVLHGCLFFWLTGQWVPEMESRQIFYLALSGIIGLSIGDQALFVALVDIGPRLSTLMMTTSPLFAAFFGWAVLGETLSGVSCLGIGLTIGGVAWVVLERSPQQPQRSKLHARGLLLALFAASCQAGGLLLSKMGMGHGFLPPEERLDPQAATLVRMFFAGFGMLPILAIRFHRDRLRRLTGLRPQRIGSPRTGLILMACGTVVGPFLGVWMSLITSDLSKLGIAQTLMSLAPLFILPLVMVIHKEKVSARAAFGVLLALGGSALLIWPGG